MSSKFYITTPIYYVNDIPHIGHAYTTIIVDVLARFHRLLGQEVFFLTGTDEHGQKIEQSAIKRGKDPKEYVDEVSKSFKDIWENFRISYDKFIRTTDSYHIQTAQKAFLKMYQRGDIYKGEYEGNYCISCEAFFTKSQLIEGEKCPDCKKKTTLVKEESYFFRLSAYQDKLLEFYKQHNDFILPKLRYNEVIKFVEAGLEDLSITRTSFDWGVKLPSEIANKDSKKHVIYVWLDALINYLSALGYENALDKKMGFWPVNYHIVGKDILRFHAIYWLAFLMSLELPLPRHVAAHGWWTKDGAKMSKSVGNVVNPQEIVNAYGLDCFRYFVLREVPFGQDGDFSQQALIERINSDLSNDLGNLLNRLLGMSTKYFNNHLMVDIQALQLHYKKELESIHRILIGLESLMQKVQISRYLEELWKIFALANGMIAKKEPWRLVKENKMQEVAELLVFIANLLIKAAFSLSPCMPKTAEEILSVFNLPLESKHYLEFIKGGKIISEMVLTPIDALFPKIEIPLLEDKQKEIKAQNFITKEEFSKIEIKIGTIIKAEVLPKSEKLLKLQVDLGEERERQIIAGIKSYYSTQELLGRQVCVLANLRPAKLMGELSEGMILAVKDDEGLSLIQPQTIKKNGSPIS